MITKQSPAKINLILRVLEKRDDGYHGILSLMQKISLYDEVEFRLTDKGVGIHCPGSNLPEDRNNIVYKAVDALFSHASYNHGVDIIIRKKIPIASGLGGGSSNAATTLVTLNDMIGFHYTTEELMKIGAKIGADVPFFVFSRTAWVSGIGDRIEKACALPPLWFVLINPDFEVSTKEIYEKLNLRLTKGTIKYNVQQFRSVPRIAGSLYNDLEIVSLKTYPVLSRIKERLMVEGALGSLMSGSGPTVFGIFRNEKSATGAARELGKLNIGSVYIAHSIE